MRLSGNLVLFDYIAALLGGGYEQLLAALRDADEGRRGDGQSYFYGVLENRASRLQFSLDDLKRCDLNILAHEATLGRAFAGFRLKYYQYMAALWTEIYLSRYTASPGDLLLALENHRAAHFPDISPFAAPDLRKLAFWMSTGSGKTFLLHVNLLQFQHYKPFVPENILLLTPTTTLCQQHLSDLAASGIKAAYALDAPAHYNGVQVLEITKLYLDGNGAKQRRGGESIPISQFTGGQPNLLFVDEGHKGTSSKPDEKTERAWRDIREALATKNGLTFEYSATFGQVTEKDDDLLAEYAHSILFEYAYARFYSDNYGKDYWAANLPQYDASTSGEMLLMGALLTFYQARRLYDDKSGEFAAYGVEPPLMVFVGAQVTAGTEVLDVVRFLDRVVRDRDWAIESIHRLLNKASGLLGPDGNDLFTGRFPYLRASGLIAAEAVYDDVTQRLFRGAGHLSLHLLKRNAGEIGLRLTDSAQDVYCGVVNVGDATGFLKKAKGAGLDVGQEDNLADSLFNAINQPASPVNFLVGSKKFIEGWSSFRVSVMGLLRVGKGAGAQVLQLFGRGVRLRGKHQSLKRSAGEAGSPPYLSLLETLSIFGLKANYLKTFLDTLLIEGVPPRVRVVLPLELDPTFERARLKALEVDPAYNFRAEASIFDPTTTVTLDLSPAAQAGGGAKGMGEDKSTLSPDWLPQELLDMDRLYYHALDFKTRKDWPNLHITRQAIIEFFGKSAMLIAPSELIAPSRPEHLTALDFAAQTLLEKGLEAFYIRRRKVGETNNLQATNVKREHPNFPTVETDTDPPQTLFAYELRVLPELEDQIKTLVNDVLNLLKQDLGEPLPRLHFDYKVTPLLVHLYNPLLVEGQQAKSSPVGQQVNSSPVGLVESEKRFVLDLQKYWEEHLSDWQDYDLYLLRNLPTCGIGFFSTIGFYPDFMLWMKREERQVLSFVEPKGMTRWPLEKVKLLAEIRGYQAKPKIGFPILAYIVTPTSPQNISGISSGTPDVVRACLKRHYVLLQENSRAYIADILAEMKEALDKAQLLGRTGYRPAEADTQPTTSGCEIVGGRL
jgi:hypothetical protein